MADQENIMEALFLETMAFICDNSCLGFFELVYSLVAFSTVIDYWFFAFRHSLLIGFDFHWLAEIDLHPLPVSISKIRTMASALPDYSIALLKPNCWKVPFSISILKHCYYSAATLGGDCP